MSHYLVSHPERNRVLNFYFTVKGINNGYFPMETAVETITSNSPYQSAKYVKRMLKTLLKNKLMRTNGRTYWTVKTQFKDDRKELVKEIRNLVHRMDYSNRESKKTDNKRQEGAQTVVRDSSKIRGKISLATISKMMGKTASSINTMLRNSNISRFKEEIQDTTRKLKPCYWYEFPLKAEKPFNSSDSWKVNPCGDAWF